MSTKENARGKWYGIFRSIGLTERQLMGKSSPCPNCDGNDRFSLDKKSDDGRYFCRGCGHGDGIDLYQKITGLSFVEACKKIDAQCGTIKQVNKTVEKTDAEKLLILQNTWRESEILSGDDQASIYLSNRGLMIPDSLKVHPSLKYSDGTNTSFYPAMLAKVKDRSGKSVSIHRTYLHNGAKADVQTPKKLMQGLGITGGAIRLFDCSITVGIAEGIETAIAAHMLFNVPVWSCISAGGLESFQPPEGIKVVYIFADNDSNFVGQCAAYSAAKRLSSEGFIVTVKVPSQVGDWLDVLNSGGV